MRSRKFLFIAVSIAALFPLSACKFRERQSSAQTLPEEKRVKVVVQQLKRQDMTQIIVTKGTFYPDERALISPKVSGKIQAIEVEEGDRVEKGQILVRMDDSQLDLDVKRAEASVEELKARLDAARIGVENARSRITAAEAAVNRSMAELELKQLEKDRMDRLVKKDSVPQQKYDYAKSAYDIAAATLESSRAELDSSKTRLKEAEASLMTAQASLAKEEKLLEIARQRLQDAKITAPIPGVITQKVMNIGEIADTGKAILVMEKMDVLELRARVSSSYLTQVKAGLPVTVLPDGIASPIQATITRVNPAIDPTDRTMEIVCAIPNPDQTLKTGLFAKIEITAQVFMQAVVVPTSAILERNNQQVVFIAEDDLARMVPVVPGYEAEEKSIILQGLKGTELLIVEGQKDLSDNEPLQVETKG